MKPDINKLRKINALKVGDIVICIQEWSYSSEKTTKGKRYFILNNYMFNDGIFLDISTDIKGETLSLRTERDLGGRFEFSNYFDLIPLKEERKEKLVRINRISDDRQGDL